MIDLQMSYVHRPPGLNDLTLFHTRNFFFQPFSVDSLRPAVKGQQSDGMNLSNDVSFILLCKGHVSRKGSGWLSP